ncbi:MAG: hypothetical protein HC888_17315, partial [Candidatus Competibacteraceae bacterium]|nr:hypothetical protein [Candidatus Competibacteraceae bacterium]
PCPPAPSRPSGSKPGFDVEISNGSGFQWELFEDGRPAASGRFDTITGTGNTGMGSIQIPQDILQSANSGFLNAACGNPNFFDRLGDDGCDDGNFRRRDVTYTFVARAVRGTRPMRSSTPRRQPLASRSISISPAKTNSPSRSPAGAAIDLNQPNPARRPRVLRRAGMRQWLAHL